MTETNLLVYCMIIRQLSSYLSNQTREHKDTNEEVGHLKGYLKGGYRFWKTPDVDQTADSKVVTTQVPVEE